MVPKITNQIKRGDTVALSIAPFLYNKKVLSSRLNHLLLPMRVQLLQVSLL